MLKTGLKITLLLAALWIGLGLIWSMKKGGQEVSYVNIASIIKSYGSLQSSAIGMSTPTNRIVLESDIDEAIGKGHGWDISGKKGDTFRVVIANSTSFTLETENSTISSPFRFDFSVQDGKKLKRGLYAGAVKNNDRGTGNGIEISGEGRTCKTVRGVFYVHEYLIEDNILQKAAIDFIQYCDGGTKGLYGSLRYNSGINPGCNYGSCTGVRRITQVNGDNPTLNSAPASSTENVSGSSLNNNTTVTTAEQEKIIADINAKIIKSWSDRYPVVAKYCSLEKILKNFNENTKLDKEICTNDRRPQIDGNKLLKTAGYPSKDALTIAYIISIRGLLEDEEIEKLLELEEKYDDSIKVGYADAQAKITETNLENRTARGKLLGQLMTTLWAEREVILLKELLAGEGI